MRKLHPVASHEQLLRQGHIRRPDGAVEEWTLHQLPAGRAVLRVAVAGERPELWHLMVDEEGRPERLELRLAADGRQLEATYTFFDDEVLVWRRGAEPASEEIAVPPGYRLLWPPVAGRDVCLARATPPPGTPDAVMCLSLARKAPERGWLSARPIKFTVTVEAGQLRWSTPGREDMVAELDARGILRRWRQGDEAWTELGVTTGP